MNQVPRKTQQRGSALIIVLILSGVMALGALALVRVTEASTLVAGNIGYRMNARMASELGVNAAFTAVTGLVDDEVVQPGWYYPTRQAEDEFGVPTTVDWIAAPSIVAGAYTVRYVVERLCEGTLPIAVLENQCLLEQMQLPGSNKAGVQQLTAPAARQFRVTVQVSGPRNTLELIQALVTRAI